MTEEIEIGGNIVGNIVGDCLELHDTVWNDSITLDWPEVAALRAYLERNPQLGTANLEPAKSANLEPAENAQLGTTEIREPSQDETGAQSQNETPALSQNETFRRQLVLAIAPQLVPGYGPAVSVARETLAIVDRIILELESDRG